MFFKTSMSLGYNRTEMSMGMKKLHTEEPHNLNSKWMKWPGTYSNHTHKITLHSVTEQTSVHRNGFERFWNATEALSSPTHRCQVSPLRTYASFDTSASLSILLQA